MNAADIRELNAYQLSHRAGVATPDALDSPGALWLLRVAEAATEALDELGEPSEWVHETAEILIPVATHEIWQVFVDLALYQAEHCEHLESRGVDEVDPDNLWQIPATVLFGVAVDLLTDLRGDL